MLNTKPNILILEPPAVSKFGNQRIFGGNGSNKSDFKKPPLDLMMISGYLRKEGFDNSLVDANSTRIQLDGIKEIFRAEKPDVVFFSTSTCTIYSDLLIARIAKEIDTSILTVAIGTHVMALPEETFQESVHLDAIIYTSEWEQASLNIVRNIGTLERAKGIFLRQARDNIVKTAPQPVTESLNDLGFPAHDKLEKEIYRDPTAKRYPKTIVMGQKACINNCNFCCQPAFFGAPDLKKRSVDNFLEELKWVSSLAFEEVMFFDNTLTADKEWASSLFEGMISQEIDLTWNCSTRADRLDSGLLRLMRKAGCHTIALGMESADPVVLKNIRKNIRPEKVRETVCLAKKEGMDTIVYSVIGFQGETRESAEKTIAFLESLDTSFITLGIAVPAPGTEFYDYVEKNNYLVTKDWSQYDPMKKPVFGYPNFSAEEIYFYSRSGLRKFYLRPKYILQRGKAIRSYSEASMLFSNFLGFLKRYVLTKDN